MRIAKNLALETWKLIAPIYDGDLKIEIKEDGSPVTNGDKEANKFIVGRLRKAFPDDGIVSEEDETKIEGKRRWYVDPIDGTKGFLKRDGHFAMHIGLEEDGNPVLGVVYWPSAGDMYSGIPGIGAWRENSRGIQDLKVKTKNEKLIAMLSSSNGPERLNGILDGIDVVEYRNNGSEGLRLMKLAEGRADIRVSERDAGPSTWDLCAPHAIFLAAGGTLKYLNGKEVKYFGQRKMEGRYVASGNPKLVDKIVKNYRAKND